MVWQSTAAAQTLSMLILLGFYLKIEWVKLWVSDQFSCSNSSHSDRQSEHLLLSYLLSLLSSQLSYPGKGGGCQAVLLLPPHGSEGLDPKLTLSSFNHFSKSCLRPCWSTGLQSSSDSYLFSCPWSSRMPKYCRRGEVCPGWAGTLWNRRMVSGVRRIPCQRERERERATLIFFSAIVAWQELLQEAGGNVIVAVTSISMFCQPRMSGAIWLNVSSGTEML